MTDHTSTEFEREFERRVARYASIDPVPPDAVAVAHEVTAGRPRSRFARFALAPYGSPAARLAVAALLLLGALVAIWVATVGAPHRPGIVEVAPSPSPSAGPLPVPLRGNWLPGTGARAAPCAPGPRA